MSKYNQIPNFNIKINYPTPENQEKYENRLARAVAKVLLDTLPPNKIDELIELYKKRKNSNS